MAYATPGHADTLPQGLIDRWNQEIARAYDALAELHSRFFTLDHASVGTQPSNAIRWFGDPAEPNFCLGLDDARALSDWGARGRQELHNEYCEYAMIYRTDATGRKRLKRVEITTELREYWCTLAVADPERTRASAEEILGQAVTFTDLYDHPDPTTLTERQRLVAFSKQTAGNGGDSTLGPKQPLGPINTERALFMTHPINGLDDLLYIVLFGAQPYARKTSAGIERSSREQIFRAQNVEHLACRHADPAAAMGAYGAAFDGRKVAFANPLGMYITSFTADAFRLENAAVPANWVRFGRGQAGWHQRLEFGPADHDAAFLDEAAVVDGAESTPITGGFQIVEKLEVGPRVVIGAPTKVEPGEYKVLTASTAAIKCSEAEVCNQMTVLKANYEAENQQPFVRVGPRKMGTRR